ncbi:MAG: RdgB/HAM1 family non-canonical purine NTP pyrophosphatase [Dehalococcoidia bacterium]|nr:RdgB/HAM1 family non-canonical purine NTP pyrophosphatase [Dehalococcoidia bacterium]
MPRLLIATNNPGKLAEFRRLLQGCGWELVSPAALGLELPDDEPGHTYEENAKIKALNGALAGGLVTLADDSGLEIDALDGAPGARSARFLGEDAGYEERFETILGRMSGLPSTRRWARFRCVVAVAEPDSDAVRLFEGEVQGLIALEPRGELGFGYDPIFYLPQRARTMAELPPYIKDVISHRGRAAMRARPLLKELLYERRQADTRP